MPELPSGSPATDFSLALLSAFVRRGVRHIVVCPGSRSQALALAAGRLETAGLVALHVRIDERVAAFTALGLAVETGVPALVITTSGSAVANLHPAVLEAHHARVPLIVVSADRPAELRGIRSNQTTVQPGMFGDAVRWEADVLAPTGAPGEADTAAALALTAFAEAMGAATSNPGPAHLNLAFREPLSAPVPPLPEGFLDVPDPLEGANSAPEPELPETELPEPELPVLTVARGPRTVVVAGSGAGPEAEELAHQGGWPLVAEITSGARFGRNLVGAYRELLADADFGGQVQRVIVFGHPTLSREVPALIGRDGVETIVVSPVGEDWYNPGRRVTQFARRVCVTDAVNTPGNADDDPSAAAGNELNTQAHTEARRWLGRWVTAGRSRLEFDSQTPAPHRDESRPATNAERNRFLRQELEVVRNPVTRDMLVDEVWKATWPHDRLVFGASRLIRVADRRLPGKRVSAHANRGLAGIDGTIATATGIGLAAPAGGVTRVLLGDLATLHDVGALLLGNGETRPRVQVIVGNDGGGTIFDGLEVARSAEQAEIDRVLYTPQRVDFAALAAAYGWTYTKASTRGELEQALTASAVVLSLIEVPLPR